MKHLILWGSLIITYIILFTIWDKITISMLIDTETSPLYVDIIFALIGLSLFVCRIISLVTKIL